LLTCPLARRLRKATLPERWCVGQVANLPPGSAAGESRPTGEAMLEETRRLPVDEDIEPYAGKWIAIVRRRVAGVGTTAQEARLAAKRNRPKDEPILLKVPEHGLHFDET